MQTFHSGQPADLSPLLAQYHLDSAPHTMSSKDHRPAYGSDGDYFSKPSAEDIFEKIYEMMHEADPNKYKSLY